MTDAPRSRLDLGKALRELPPVQQALSDPQFSLTARPVDASWHHTGFTGVMAGFNPTLHTHFYASESAFARWLDDLTAVPGERAGQVELAKEVLHMAHDYLHSWMYRALAAVEPELVGYGPVTRDNLEEQAFFLVVSEAVAVVGLDYWYLCVADIDERCRVTLGVGPRTVHYRERLLSEYRRFHPSLTVQEPQFFHRILRLYASGVFDGFDVEDLHASPPLADWLVRELLISPRQREVARAWLSQLGGFALDEDELTRPFPAPSDRLRHHLTRLAELLWRKIKHGESSCFSRPSREPWRYPPGAAIDFRFANLQRVPDHIDPCTASGESARFYVDQYLSRFPLPSRDAEAIAALQRDVDAIKRELDPRRLAQLASALIPVGGAPDPGPLELLFVN